MNLSKRIRDRVGDREDILANQDARHSEELALRSHGAADKSRQERNRRKRRRRAAK